MNNKYFVVYCHDTQIEWFTAFAEYIKKEQGIESVCIVQGKEDKSRALATNIYTYVIDILEKFDSTNAKDNLDFNLNCLKEWESKNHETNFFKDVDQDRWLNKKYTYEYIVHFGVHIIKELDELLKKYPPLVVIGEKNALQYRILHHYSQLLNFPQFTLLGARHFAADRFYFEPDIYWGWHKIRHFYNQFKEQGIPKSYLKDAKDKYEQITKKHFNAEKKKVKRGEEKFSKKLNFSLFISFFTGLKKTIERDKYANPRVVTIDNPFDRIKLFLHKRKSQAIFEKLAASEVNTDKPFASYFLHLQPEYTIDGLGYGVNNQVELIRVIASSLPADHILYVKEHTVAVGQRPLNFYQNIVNTPNVKLVSDQVDGHLLIKKAKIVFSVTGTAALEATYHKVPTVLFGDIFHTHFDGITQLKISWNLLHERIVAILNKPEVYTSNEFNSLCIIAAMLAASYPGCVSPVFIKTDQIHKSPNKELLGKALMDELKYFNKLKPEVLREI